MPVGDFQEGRFVCGILAPGALFRLGVEFQLVEEKVAHLLRGRYVEKRVRRNRPDPFFPLFQLFPESRREIVQFARIDLDTVPLHLGEDLHQGLLHRIVEFRERAHLRMDPFLEKKNGGRFGIALPGRLFRLVEKGQGPGLFPGLEVDSQIALGEVFQFMAPLGPDQVVHQRDVEKTPFQRDSDGGEEVHLPLQVISGLGDGRIFEEGAERFRRPFRDPDGSVLRQGKGHPRRLRPETGPVRIRHYGHDPSPGRHPEEFIRSSGSKGECPLRLLRHCRLFRSLEILPEGTELILRKKVR